MERKREEKEQEVTPSSGHVKNVISLKQEAFFSHKITFSSFLLDLNTQFLEQRSQ